MLTYLMLDKDDITNVCGSISRKDFLNEVGLSSSAATNFISQGKLFRDKYILIEDYEDMEDNSPLCQLVVETECMKKYYATSDGKFYVIYKSGKKKYLNGYIKKHRDNEIFCVKLGAKEYTAKNLIASLFIKEYKSQDTVILKNNRNPRNVEIDNLIVIDKAKYARMTGPMSRSKKVCLYEDGKKVRTFRSAREAGKKLFCSYQTVLDACNNRYKTKMYDVRWES